MKLVIVGCLLLTLLGCAQTRASVVHKNFGTNIDLVLLGSAVKKFVTFPIVSVDLYIANGHQSKDIFNEIPKRLEVNYHIFIPRQELGKATFKGIEDNSTKEELAVLLPKIEQMNSYYPDVKSGDQIAVTYTPGLGSQVQINGQDKGIVAGSDFAKAFFAIWVGDNPVDIRAKSKLLGRS